MLEQFDKSSDNFRHYACSINCGKSSFLCKNEDLFMEYICYKIYGSFYRTTTIQLADLVILKFP